MMVRLAAVVALGEWFTPEWGGRPKGSLASPSVGDSGGRLTATANVVSER
jgi:hypothetical protein